MNKSLIAGASWVLNADIKGYFDAIHHDVLIAMLQEKVADQTLIELAASYLTQYIFDGMNKRTPIKGSPQGAVLSPILRGWFEYFKHARHTLFRYIDGFVRRRLRSILRK